ncbi:MAG: DUF4252 domain-containing protein [Acidobacteria bacterium]|nr:DUF4252 domain-containing protein [Acidobacteriota bacterium]
MKVQLIALLSFASLLFGQRLQLNLDHLAKKAAKTEDVNVDGAMMQHASSFLSDKNKDEKSARKLVKGMDGVYVRSFKFDKPGEFTEADIDSVRRQLQAPGWSRMVSTVDKKKGKIEEVYFHATNGKSDGMVVLDIKPAKFEVVNIVGSVDMGRLSEMGENKKAEQ